MSETEHGRSTLDDVDPARETTAPLNVDLMSLWGREQRDRAMKEADGHERAQSVMGLVDWGVHEACAVEIWLPEDGALAEEEWWGACVIHNFTEHGALVEAGAVVCRLDAWGDVEESQYWGANIHVDDIREARRLLGERVKEAQND